MKNLQKAKLANKIRRRLRIKAKVAGTPNRPRLSVFRSSKYIYAQIIDDTSGTTLIAASKSEVKEPVKGIELAEAIGLEIGKKALAKKINKVVFDRGGYKYHGQIKALADGARKAGLSF